MKIYPGKFYSLLEVQKLTKIKSRSYLARYIKEGTLLAIVTGGDDAKRRYAIKGEWVSDFIDRYKKGLVRGKAYTKKEIKKIIEDTLSNLN